jgi:alpha-N-acetylglucosamine transferase
MELQTNSKYAFIIMHFGNKIKYLELEIYLSIMLRKNSVNDIIYLYSVNDTPIKFINIMKKYCNFAIPYDDKGITYEIENFKSYYQHFNTLRTCNFIFAYKLIQYKKVCIIESDTIILHNIDDIFDIKTPSILTYYDKSKALKNYKIKVNFDKTLLDCATNSDINGGTIVLKPSIKKYDLAIKNIKLVIKNNCKYPNEILLLLINKKIYNLPFKYNGVQYNIQDYSNYLKINPTEYLSIVHINANEHKHVDIIKDNWLDKIKIKKKYLYYFINIFKIKYYDKYNESITKMLSDI